MDRLRQDVHYAVRTLFKGPLFAFTVVGTLGLGIGANTAIFSFVDAMLLEPLPHPRAEELVMIWQDFGSTGGPEREWFTPPDYEDLRSWNGSLAAVTPLLGWQPNLTGVEEPERLSGLIVSTDYFAVAGVQPALGRGFAPEDATGDVQVVVISHELWQRRFGGDPGVLHRTLLLNGVPYTVIGVMPEGFRAPFRSADIWRPYTTSTFSTGCGRSCYVMQVLARLRPGVLPVQAASELDALATRIREAAPGEKQGMALRVVPLKEQVMGPIQPALVALLGAVGLLLLIACVNIANLLLARSAAREREVAVRTAMGASRGVIVRQLVTESLLIALAGGAVGILLAFWGVDLLVGMSPPGTPRLEDVRVDMRALTFAFFLAALTGMLFGLFPALQLARVNTSDVLKESGGLRAGVARRRARSALVAGEIAIALTLLAGAGLMLRSFARIQAVDPGFDPQNTLAMQLLLPRAKYPDANAGKAFWAQLLERVRAHPNVVAAGLTSVLPLSGDNTDVSFVIEGRPVPRNREEMSAADYRIVTPGLADALGMALLRGRALRETDGEGAPRVALINETMADRYWPDEDPVGERFSVNGAEGPWITVEGVIADVHHRGPAQPVRPEIYLPFEQQPVGAAWLVIRTRNDPTQLAPIVRAELRALDPDLPVAGQTTMDTLMRQAVAMPRLFVTFFTFFAVVAMLLAAVGIYGVTAQTVSQRTPEIGVRVALGAAPREVVGMIVRESMLVASAGLGLGLVAALLLSRTLETLLFQLDPRDPVTFGGMAAILAIVALLASWAPARRAAAVSPIRALRAE